MCDLGLTFIETLIVSVPDTHHSIEALAPIWKTLEKLVKTDKVYSLGISDLKKDELEQLYETAQVVYVLFELRR